MSSQTKQNSIRTRHISAQIQKLPGWNLNASDPKISSETNSSKVNNNNSNYCFRYIKPKSKDENRAAVAELA